MVLRPLSINVIEPLGFNHTVNESTRKASTAIM